MSTWPRSGEPLRLFLAAVLLVACGVGGPIDDITPSLARVAGTACLRPILASAVLIENGRLLTVAHAIAGAEDDLSVVTLDGTKRSVSVLAFDPDRDLALLGAEGLNGAAPELGVAEAGDRGTIVAVTGDLGLRSIEYRVARTTMASSGDIYDQGEVLRSVLDLEALVGPGDSGAPLIDENGAMVGLVFAKSTDRESAAWALAVEEIEAFLSSVVDNGEVDRGRCR